MFLYSSILNQIPFLVPVHFSSFMDLFLYCGTASSFTVPSAHNPYLVSCSNRGDVLLVRGVRRYRRCPQALEGLQDSSGPWPAPGHGSSLVSSQTPGGDPHPVPEPNLHPHTYLNRRNFLTCVSFFSLN